MAGETKPFDDRELARRIVERGIRSRAIPGTKGTLQRLNQGELDYLRWLGAKVQREMTSASDSKLVAMVSRWCELLPTAEVEEIVRLILRLAEVEREVAHV